MSGPWEITLPQGPFSDAADMEAQIVAEVERAHGARNCFNCGNIVVEDDFDWGAFLLCKVHDLRMNSRHDEQYFRVIKCTDWKVKDNA